MTTKTTENQTSLVKGGEGEKMGKLIPTLAKKPTREKKEKRKMKFRYTFFFILLPFLVQFAFAKEVNVYSYRQQYLIEPILEAFTEKTGIEVNVVYASKGLVERIKNEGRRSPADVILTTDIGIIDELEKNDLLRAVNSRTITRNIPANFRSPDSLWFGLTSRARVVYASKERVNEGEIKSYEDLIDPKWRNKICIRSGYHPYNIALIASLIANKGSEFAENWLTGLKRNLARKPQSNDRGQVKAINEGICDLALGNTYYYGIMLTNYENPEQIDWAKNVQIVFPNQNEEGTHINITAMALLKYSPNRRNGIALMNFLTEDLAQYKYAQENHEFPIKKGVPLSNLVRNFMGDFKKDTTYLLEIAKHRSEAAKLVDKVNFDN